MTEQKTISEIITLVEKDCKKGNINNAIIYLNEAIEIYPHDARHIILRGLRGRLKLDQGNHEDAIEDYTKAIEIDPNNDLSYELRADAKSKLRDYQGAINDYSKAIEINPKKVYLYNYRASAKRILGDNEGAIEDYTKAIELLMELLLALEHNNNIQFSKSRIRSLLAQKDYQGLVDDYSKATEFPLKTKFNISLVYADRAKVKTALGDYQGAIDDFAKAIELNPRKANLYNYRAGAKRKLGDNEGADEDYRKAEKLINPFKKS